MCSLKLCSSTIQAVQKKKKKEKAAEKEEGKATSVQLKDREDVLL